MLMPEEQWEDFKNNALQRYNEETQAFLKLAFVAGLSSATEFFSELISDELEPDVKQDLYKRWMSGVTTALEKYALELARFAEMKNGSTN